MKERIVFLVTIFTKMNKSVSGINYLFRNKQDAIDLIEKEYYMKPTKKSGMWKDEDKTARLIELFLR